jgi:hypothetical protein
MLSHGTLQSWTLANPPNAHLMRDLMQEDGHGRQEPNLWGGQPESVGPALRAWTPPIPTLQVFALSLLGLDTVGYWKDSSE